MIRLPSLATLDREAADGGVRTYLCVEPTDMRKGFDTLAALVRDTLRRDPLSGALFLFISRRRDRMKILHWDGDGFALWYKRLEVGQFRVPRIEADATSVELKASELAMLLDGIDLRSVRRSARLRLDRPRKNRPAS